MSRGNRCHGGSGKGHRGAHVVGGADLRLLVKGERRWVSGPGRVIQKARRIHLPSTHIRRYPYIKISIYDADVDM